MIETFTGDYIDKTRTCQLARQASTKKPCRPDLCVNSTQSAVYMYTHVEHKVPLCTPTDFKKALNDAEVLGDGAAQVVLDNMEERVDCSEYELWLLFSPKFMRTSSKEKERK